MPRQPLRHGTLAASWLLVAALAPVGAGAAPSKTVTVIFEGQVVDRALVPTGIQPVGRKSNHPLANVRMRVFEVLGPGATVSSPGQSITADVNGRFHFEFDFSYDPAKFESAGAAWRFYRTIAKPKGGDRNFPLLAVVLADSATEGGEMVRVVDTVASVAEARGPGLQTIYALDRLPDVEWEKDDHLVLYSQKVQFGDMAATTKKIQQSLVAHFGQDELALIGHPLVNPIYPKSEFVLGERIFDTGVAYSAAVSYYHVERARRAITSALAHDLRNPVRVSVFSTAATPTFYEQSSGTIVIGATRSTDMRSNANLQGSWYADNREWHEFGHHVMRDLYGAGIFQGADTFHDGYWRNANTRGALAEGYATWVAMIIAEQLGDPAPWLYSAGSGAPVDLERAPKVWAPGKTTVPSTNEEFAVAGFLWDLHDGAKEFRPGTRERDEVSITAARIQGVFAAVRPTGLKALYVAIAGQFFANDTTPLENLAIRHGMHADGVDAQGKDAGERNFAYDEAEAGTFGSTASRTNPERRTRDAVPVPEGSHVRVTARDGAGTPVVVDLVVERRYPAPEEGAEVSRLPAVADGERVFVRFASPTLPERVVITAEAPRRAASAPLVITGTEYFDLVEAAVGGAFLEHEFVVGPADPAQVGLFDHTTARWHLRTRPGGAVAAFTYGSPGDLPIVGDWDCDGVETAGVWRPATQTFLLRNRAGRGVADVAMVAGNPGDLPLAGDWDGDGCGDVGLFRPAEARIYLFLDPEDRTTRAFADHAYYLGEPGDLPFAGDFDGDRADTAGVYRPRTGFAYLRNIHDDGPARAFFYGSPGDVPVAGDWDGDGRDTVAVFRPGSAEYLLRNSNSSGIADERFHFGELGWQPVVGYFSG